MKRPFTLRLPDGKKYEFLADDWHDAQEIITEWLSEECKTHKYNPKGVCSECDYECDHQWKENCESGSGKFCIECQMIFESHDPRMEPEYWGDR